MSTSKGRSPCTTTVCCPFEDKWAFYLHQASDYHEGHDFESVLANVALEYLDPVKGANGLPPTENPPLPEDASETLRNTEQVFPILIPAGGQGGPEAGSYFALNSMCSDFIARNR